MGTRTCAQLDPTPATIALNAFIFGYGGHSLVTPHTTLKQLWWTDDRIKSRLTDGFIFSKLRGEERNFLNRQVGFGEGLTDDTYMEWIKERAKRLFLILCDVGVPDQIFGCIDDSWDDDDLPISLEDVQNLELAVENDEALNRKFHDTQFVYLLRELVQGSHIDYGHNEHIPMEHVSTLPPAVSLQIWDRIHFPGRSDDVYMRRKHSLAEKDTGKDLRSSFLKDVRKAQAFEHEHIASAWASYTTGDSGYIISDFVGEHTLATFINHRNPTSFQRLRPSERPIILCEWMHCLSDALASLHHRGTAHTAIRPSNILIDHSNRIAFADVGSLRSFQRGKKTKQAEMYEYAAPETRLAQAPFSLPSSPPTSSRGAFNRLRKLSSSTSGSSTGSSNGSSSRSNSWCTAQTSPGSPISPARSDSISTIAASITTSPKSPTSTRNFSRHLTHSSITSATNVSSSPTTIIHLVPSISTTSGAVDDQSEAPPEVSDIFSLGCNFLDIITFMVKGKTNDFVKFRTTRVTTPNKNKTRNDTSFHFDLDKIEQWVEMLKEDSRKLNDRIYRGVPALLDLILAMMAGRWSQRPTAVQVRDRIQEILVGECEVETLCCAGREWVSLPTSDYTDNTALNKFFRDSMSVATGAPSVRSQQPSVSVCGAIAYEDTVSPTTRPGSSMASVKSRRGSSNSAATVKDPRVSSWRRAFSRGSRTG